jgi:hypothetical protein
VHDQVTGLHRMGMALEGHGQQRDVPDISAGGFTSLHSDRVLCSAVQWHDIVKIQIQQAMSCDYLNRFVANATFKSLH